MGVWTLAVAFFFTVGLASSGRGTHFGTEKSNPKERQKAERVANVEATRKAILFESPAIPCDDSSDPEFSQDRKSFTVANQGRISRYDALTGAKMGEVQFPGDAKAFEFRVMSALGSFLAKERDGDLHTRLYDLQSGKLVLTSDPEERAKKGVTVLEPGERVLNETLFHSFLTIKDGTLIERRFPSGAPTDLRLPIPKGGDVAGALLSRDRSKMAVVSAPRDLNEGGSAEWIVLNTKSGKELSRTPIAIEGGPEASFVSSDFSSLRAVARATGKAIAVDLAKASYDLKDHPAEITSLSGDNSPGGILLAGMKNHSVRVWDLPSGRPAFDLQLPLRKGETIDGFSGPARGARLLVRIRNEPEGEASGPTCRVALIDVLATLPDTSRASFQDLWKALDQVSSPETFAAEVRISSEAKHTGRLLEELSQTAARFSKIRIPDDQKKVLDSYLKDLNSDFRTRQAGQGNLSRHLDSLSPTHCAEAAHYLANANVTLEVKRRVESVLLDSERSREQLRFQVREPERLQFLRGVRALHQSILIQPPSELRNRSVQLLEQLAQGDAWRLETRLARELLVITPPVDAR